MFKENIKYATKFHKCAKEYDKSDNNNITVLSIDTSGDRAKLIPTKKILYPPMRNQDLVKNIIIDRWNSANHFNIKVIIHGKRGIGKSYLGCILKRYIETTRPLSCVRLYDDFNPTSIGVNIRTLALSTATKETPVIIIINEIDTVFNKVLDPQEPFDPRLQHTRNKNEFHNMLDNIGLTPFVIAIYTTELSFEQIVKNNNYGSFIRPGRIDLFVEMKIGRAHV